MTTQSADEWKAKGNAAFGAKNFEEAVSCFSEAIKMSPNDHVLYSNRSGAYASLSNFEKSYEDACKCVELSPEWPKGYSRKGYAEFHLGKIQEAIATYKKGLELDPENGPLKAGLEQAQAAHPEAQAQQRVGLMVASLLRSPKFQKYAEEDPGFTTRLTSLLGGILNDPTNIHTTMSMCSDPKVKEALSTLLGLSSEDTFNGTGAKAADGTSNSTSTNDGPTAAEKEAEEWKEKGGLLYKEKKFEEALAAFDKAIELNPKEILYQSNKAAVYLEMGQYDACLAECQKALDRRYDIRADFTKVAKIYNRMAACYKRMEEYDKAIEMYEKSLTEHNNRHTRNALAELRRFRMEKRRQAYLNPEKAQEHRLKGNEFFKNNQFPEAKAEYDEAIRRNPEDPQLYANRAATYMKLYEYPLALQDVDRSLELDPKVPKVWARKGNIHTFMKEYNKAMNAYQAGLEIEPDNVQCNQGLTALKSKIHSQTTSDQVDEEQIKRSMADPEVQRLLQDPQFCMLLNELSRNPAKMAEALKDRDVASNIQKLITAGILKVA